jgi:hypothetical protein
VSPLIVSSLSLGGPATLQKPLVEAPFRDDGSGLMNNCFL